MGDVAVAAYMTPLQHRPATFRDKPVAVAGTQHLANSELILVNFLGRRQFQIALFFQLKD